MRTTFTVITFALLAAGAALAGEPTGLQRDEVWSFYSVNPPDDPDPNDNVFYDYAIPVPCLGPGVYMEGTEHVVLWAREFISPSGAYLLNLHFRNEVEFHDQYGNTWTGSGEVSIKDVDPWVPTTHKYVAHILFKPVLGDGAMWQMRNVGMIRVKDDGRVVVDRPPGGSWVEIERCLPAKKK
jgi:hypothetical protein